MKLIHLGPASPQNLPNLRFRPAPADRLLELAALLPLLANGIYVLVQYRRLGDALPSDCYSLLLTALLLFLLLFGAGYLPLNSINFPFRLKPHTVARQYVLALRFCRAINIVLSLMFLFATLAVYHPWADAARAGCLVLLILVFAGYFCLAWRAR